jgi:lysophospholipase L1-like esterase
MNILCFGDSNTFGISPVDGKRLAECERWPGMLAELLGSSDHLVIEAGATE